MTQDYGGIIFSFMRSIITKKYFALIPRCFVVDLRIYQLLPSFELYFAKPVYDNCHMGK